MFAPLKVEVQSVGEDVVLAIGSWNRTMHFETAVMLASWMDECAREAKKWSGNVSFALRGVGTLHDASNPHWLNEGQPFDPRRVFPVNRDLLKKHSISVRQEMAMVVLVAGAVEAKMPYQAALTISQWVRVRAKESQLRAGDATRHWSVIAKEHQRDH